MPYDAKRFDDIYAYVKPLKKILFEKNIENMNFDKNEIVLDVGCGTGRLTSDVFLPNLKKFVKYIVAVDIDKSMLSLAEENYSHPQIYYKELDFSVPITEKKKRELFSEETTSMGFDKLVSFFCFMKIRNQRLVARNIFTLLKPGGEALLVLNGKSDEAEMMLGLSKMPKWSQYMQNLDNHVSPYHSSKNATAEMTQYLKEAGLQVIYCKEHEEVVCFENADIFKYFMSSLNTCLSEVPPEKREEFMNDGMEIIKVNKRSNKYVMQVLTALVRKSETSTENTIICGKSEKIRPLNGYKNIS